MRAEPETTSQSDGAGKAQRRGRELPRRRWLIRRRVGAARVTHTPVRTACRDKRAHDGGDHRRGGQTEENSEEKSDRQTRDDARSRGHATLALLTVLTALGAPS